MMFLRDYFRVLVPLFIAFAIYHATIVPLIEPGPSKAERTWPSVPIAMRDNWWEELFAEGEWQRDKQNPPRVVNTESAVLLFQSREQKSATRWLVKPLTILIPQRDSATSKRAMLIRNNEGAEIQFKTAVDWTTELPPIVSGQLLGEISITSPPENESKNNGMVIHSRDLRIDKRQIWTNQRVQFRYGNSLVEGSFLQIFMDKDLLASEQAGSKKKSPFNGLDRLELTYVERVHIGLDPGGLWPRKDLPDIANRQAHATLKCGGSFEFKFHDSRAVLTKGVHMEHVVQGLPVDVFDCNELQMTVGWQTKQNAAAPPALGIKPNSNWNVERLEAFGAAGKNSSDHSGWLKLDAPGMQAEALGQHLDMDIVNGKVTLSNRLPGSTTREMSPVYLRREAVQVWSPEVDYQSAASIAGASQDPSKQNSPNTANRLGAIIAKGAGRAQMDNNGDSWKLSWGERLLVRPDPNELSKDLVDIKGSANISSATQGRFQAEQLYLWLVPATPEIAMDLAANSTDGKSPQWLPDRIEADGKVDVNSPSLRATVEKMQIWFEYQSQVAAASPLERSQSTRNPNPTAPTLNLLPSTGANEQPLRQPASSNSNANKSGLLSGKPTSPLVITSKTMIAKVLRSGNESRVEKLKLDGNLTLTKNQLSDGSPWPFAVTGDTLHLIQNGIGYNDIAIVGQPAKVAVGSGWVEAPELKLKQSENQFWIDHPGRLLLPVELIQKSNATPLADANLVSLPSALSGTYRNSNFTPSRPTTNQIENRFRWLEAPLLEWGGRMTFDGRIARFGGGVSLHCRMETDPRTLWHIKASSNQLAVEMDRPISMRSGNDGDAALPSQISLIRLEDNVDLQAVQTDPKMQRRSMEQMIVPQLDIFVPTQLWLAHGPGEIISRRLGNEDSMTAILPTSASNTASSGRYADTAKQCIHLSFAGRMEGDMGQRKATFYDRILALIGPIASWEDALNVHAVDRPGRNQSILNSDQLSIFDASSLSWNQPANRIPNTANNSAWEIIAQSRVQMQSNTDSGEVYATGDSLKYTAVTDTVRIDGSPQQPAHINTTGFNGLLKSASYRLRTGEFEGKIIRIEGDVPSNLQPNQGLGGPPRVQPSASPNSNTPSIRDIPLRPQGRN
jgi:hypothetical protein